jgi:Ni/Co efflux regulator RcnB
MAREVSQMRWLIALGVAFTIASPITASAGKPKKDKKHHKEHVVIVFREDERETVRHYFVEKHGHGHCPPGLAKKHNGCLPPGQAKKRYVVGHPVPHGVAVEEVPAELRIRIGAPPEGYRYGIVDGDLVKLAVGTMLVVDAINGLVQ